MAHVQRQLVGVLVLGKVVGCVGMAQSVFRPWPSQFVFRFLLLVGLGSGNTESSRPFCSVENLPTVRRPNLPAFLRGRFQPCRQILAYRNQPVARRFRVPGSNTNQLLLNIDVRPF